MQGWQRLVRTHTEAVSLAAALVVIVGGAAIASDRALGPGLFAVGLVGGGLVALQALGIVVVYRATRVINFSQLQLGVTASMIFFELVSRRSLLQGISRVCSTCIGRPDTVGELLARAGGTTLPTGAAGEDIMSAPVSALLDELPPNITIHDLYVAAAPKWLVHVDYWLAFVVSVAIATVLVWAVYALIIKRFNEAPKLVLTVVTIAAGGTAHGFASYLLRQFFGDVTDPNIIRFSDGRAPVSTSFTIDPVVFSFADVLAVVLTAALVGGLLVWFKRSRSGVVLRGTAENPVRASTLGVDVGSVTGRAWLIAGLLSGLAAVLTTARFGGVGAEGLEGLVRALAAAVAGSLVGLPLAVAGALVVGVIDQVVQAATGGTAITSATLLGLIVVMLLAQRSRASRAELDAGASWQASKELRPIPAQLRHLGAVRHMVVALAVILALFTLGYPWFMSAKQIVLGSTVFSLGIVALSLLVLTGWAGQISLAQMAFAAVGGWVTAVLGWPFPLSVLAGAAVGAVVAAIVGLPALRLRGQHLAIATLAFGAAASAVLFSEDHLGRHLPDSLRRPLLLGIDFEDHRAFYYLTLVLLAAAIVATAGMRRSRIARALIAARDNEQASRSFGIPVVRLRIAAFAISGFMAAFAGGLIAYAEHGLQTQTFSPGQSVAVFLGTLIGGLGAIAGPVIGALYSGALSLLEDTAFADLTKTLLSPSLGILVLLALMPGGLSQALWAVRDAWLRRVADRHRIIVPSLIADRAATDVILPIRPALGPTGAAAFVPKRYRLDDQWMVERQQADVVKEPASG